MRRTGWWWGVCVFLWASLSWAQTQGFALNRFEPAERGSDWFASESLDLRGHLRWAAGATLDYAHKPLVAYAEDDSEYAALVKRQFYVHLGGALTLSDRFRVGLAVPALLDSSGQSVTSDTGQFDAPSGAALGDIRLGADVRLVGKHGKAFTLAGGLWLYIPSGDSASFAGDGSLRLTPHVAAAGQVQRFEYAAKTGVHVRTTSENFGAEPFGSEVQLGLAAGYRVQPALLLGAEWLAATVVSDSGGFLDPQATPMELLLGGHYRHKDWNFGLGAGPGLTKGLGSPALRVLLSVEWSPNAEQGGAL